MIAKYTVRFWDEFLKDESCEVGVACAEGTLGDVVNRVCDWFGKENVISIEVSECEDIINQNELKEMFDF